MVEYQCLVTGFGPFAATADNPSALVAARMGLPYEVLGVSYLAVDEWHKRIQKNPPEVIVHLGYAKGTHLRFERIAKNQVGAVPDVCGVAFPDEIVHGAKSKPGNLWRAEVEAHWDPTNTQWSDDAGTYLCNYIYYQSLTKLPATMVGFVHVPDLDVVSLDDMVTTILDTLQRCLYRI